MGNYCTTSVTELPDASTVIEGTELPEWVSAGGKALFEQAANIAQSPYPSYTGPRITTYDGSKLTPEEQQAAEILGRGTSSYEPYVSEAGERAMGLGQGYDSMSREELLGPDYEGATREELIGKAMDPFSLESAQPYLDIYQTAADPAVREAGQTMFDTLAGIRAKASQGAGSFGSRLGILEGQTIADAARLKGDIRSQAARDALGFAAGRYDADRAQSDADRAARFRAEEAMRGRFTEDRTARFGAEDAARTAYETEEAAKLRATQQLEGMAPLVQGLEQQAAAGLISSGEARRALDQMALDLAYSDYVDQRQYPMDMLNFALGALQGVPYSTQNVSLQTGKQYIQNPSIYGQTIGGLGALYNAYKLAQT
jgi:hypothetical protein